MIYISAFLTSIGFSILFNMPKRLILAAGLCGLIGQVGYSITFAFTSNATVSLFVAAVFLSITSEIEARVLKSPSTMFLLCALIPFVPGRALYYTAFNFVQKNNTLAISYGLETIFGIIAIVMGCTLVSGIVQTLINNKRKRMKSNI